MKTQIKKTKVAAVLIFLLLALAGGSFGSGFRDGYTDAGDDHLWRNPDNWQPPGVPTLWADMTNEDTICIIDETHVGSDKADVSGAYIAAYGYWDEAAQRLIPFSNELHITGGEIETQFFNVGRGRSDSRVHGYFEITGGLVMTNHFRIPEQFNLTDVRDWPPVPSRMISGKADLHGGQIHVFSDFHIGTHEPDIYGGGIGTADINADCTIYWYGGDEDTGHLDDVNNFVDQGWLYAYNTDGYVTRRFEIWPPDYPEDPNVLVTIISGIFTYPQPREGKVGAPVDTDLRWAVDPDPADPNRYDVYLCTGEDCNNVALVASDLADTYYDPPGDLLWATQYCWRVDRKLGGQTYTGDLWTFTTQTPVATFTSPGDGATDVAPSAILEWDAAPPADFHDVYFGTEYNLVATGDVSVFIGRQAGTTYDPSPDMDWGTDYYLRVDEVLGSTPYTGDVWSFSTWALKAHLINPDDGIWQVDPNVVCEWADPPGVGYKRLYFGTSETLVTARDASVDLGAWAGTTYNPDPDLAWDTYYYWAVDVQEGEFDDDPNYPGDVWSFRTFKLQCTFGAASGDTNGDCAVGWDDLKILTDNWLACGWNITELCP